jgi:hypothetical protein
LLLLPIQSDAPQRFEFPKVKQKQPLYSHTHSYDYTKVIFGEAFVIGDLLRQHQIFYGKRLFLVKLLEVDSVAKHRYRLVKG